MQTDPDLALVAINMGGVELPPASRSSIVERCARIIEITSVKWHGVINHDAELYATAVRKHGGGDDALAP